MKIAFVFAFLGCSLSGLGQTISTDAPSVSASATTVPEHVFQIESSFNLNGNFEHDRLDFTTPFNLLKFGLTDKLELRHTHSITGLESHFGGDYSYIKTLGLGVKYNIVDNPEGKTQLGILGHYDYTFKPSQTHTASFIVAVNQKLAEKHALGFNIGYARNMTFEDKKAMINSYMVNNYNASLMYSFAPTDKLSFFAEIYGSLYDSELIVNDVALIQQDGESISVDFGILYLLRENIQIDYAGGLGLNTKAYFHSLGFNIMLNYKDK